MKIRLKRLNSKNFFYKIFQDDDEKYKYCNLLQRLNDQIQVSLFISILTCSSQQYH